MDTEKIRSLLNQAIAELGAPPVTGPNVVVVKAGQSLQAAHDAAAEGSIISIEPGTYAETLTSSKRLTWQPSVPVSTGRAKRDTAPVTIKGASGALINKGSDAKFVGIGFASGDPQSGIITDTGIRLSLNRVVVLGDPVKGGRRGILANGQGASLTQCYMDDLRLPAKDTQAVLGYEGTKDLVIDDCYLAGGAETVMFGGADSSADDKVPNGIKITRSTLTKNPAWFGEKAQIKNAFELKAARNVTMTDCILEYAGISEGQSAYLIALTVRNQDGKAPWSTIENVTIERCLCRFAGGGVNILGTDNNHPSGTLNNVVLRNVAFTDLDPKGITQGSGWGFLFGGGAKNVTLDGITLKGKNLRSTMYFLTPPPVGLVLNNMAMDPSTYGIKIDNAGAGVPALLAYAPDAKVTLDGSGAVGYPTV